MGRSCLQRDLPGLHEDLRGGQDWPILAAFRLRETQGNEPPDPRMACAEIGPVLFQWARSPAHWSCQRRYTCR